jgi:hypothetical protein
VYIVLVLLLSGCNSSLLSLSSEPNSISQTCSTTQSDSKLDNLPDFLQEVSPAAGSEIKLEEYLASIETFGGFGGIYAILEMEEIVEEGEHLGLDTIKDKVSICVDTIQVDNTDVAWKVDATLCHKYDGEGERVASYACPHSTIYLPILLEPGEHTASIWIRQRSGDTLEYSWMFSIIP